eukprot:1004291-Amphidinium_carterae.1
MHDKYPLATRDTLHSTEEAVRAPFQTDGGKPKRTIISEGVSTLQRFIPPGSRGGISIASQAVQGLQPLFAESAVAGLAHRPSLACLLTRSPSKMPSSNSSRWESVCGSMLHGKPATASARAVNKGILPTVRLKLEGVD